MSSQDGEAIQRREDVNLVPFMMMIPSKIGRGEMKGISCRSGAGPF
jgi:hypothetical protein